MEQLYYLQRVYPGGVYTMQLRGYQLLKWRQYCAPHMGPQDFGDWTITTKKPE